MTDSESSTHIVRRLVELVAKHNLAELELEQDGLSITIRGQSAAATPTAAGVSPNAAQAQPESASLGDTAGDFTDADSVESHPDAVDNSDAGLTMLESPMVGVFYRAATPEDPPMVSVGDIVRKGQHIGIIEAMKVFSEIPADHAGRVVRIAADNGKLVSLGEPLMYLEPL